MTAPAPSDDTFEAAVRRADPDRWLSSRFIADPLKRADVIALYAYDHELERAGLVASNTLIAEIRLAWWREVLDEVFGAHAVRRHPVAIALADIVARHDLARAPLEAMIDARIDRLDWADPGPEARLAWAEHAPGSAAMLAARILDPAADPKIATLCGRAWGLRVLGRASVPLLAKASRAARRLSAAAFPAVAHATLCRDRTATPLEARLRLVWAVSSGRL